MDNFDRLYLVESIDCRVESIEQSSKSKVQRIKNKVGISCGDDLIKYF
jgi:hypothetical protein